MLDVIEYVGRVTQLALLAKQAADKLKNAELSMLVADLVSSGAELKMKLAEQLEEIAKLKASVVTLTADKEALQAKLDAANQKAVAPKATIDGHRYEAEMTKALLLLAKHAENNIKIDAIARHIGKDVAVGRHIMEYLQLADLVIHHWGIGVDHGYSIASAGTSWLIEKGLLK